MPPTFAGFLAFLQNTVAIPSMILSDSGVQASCQTAYDWAIAIVNLALSSVPSPTTSPSVYATAVYNLGADQLFNIAQDPVSGSPPVPAIYQNGMGFFAYMRDKFNIYGFVGGVVQSTGDQGTSESMVIQDAAKLFTLSDIQNLKTPWGRAYLSISQAYGYLVGLT